MRRPSLPSLAVQINTTMDALYSVGRSLGDAAAALYAPTYPDFVYLLAVANTPLLPFVEVALALRRNRRTRRGAQAVLGALVASVEMPRWVHTLLQSAYALYVVARLEAVPREPQAQPYVAGPGVPSLSVWMLRRLRTMGMRWMTPALRRSLKERGTAAVRQLDAECRGKYVVLWFDNFWKRRYVMNPSVGYHALNATVAAVHIAAGPIPAALPFPDVEDLPVRCRLVAIDVRRERAKLRALVEAVGVGRLTREDVRIPLDVARQGGVAPEWRPARVLDHEMNLNRDIVTMLGFCHAYMVHCNGQVLPLLLDEKLHYKLLLFVYGQGYQRYPVAERLQLTPPLFGMWHVYKQLVTAVWRTYHVPLIFLLKGAV